MKASLFSLLIGILALPLLANAGDKVDTSGPKPAPPTETVAASGFTKSDCDEKIAELEKSHKETLKRLRTQLKNQKNKIQSLQSEMDTLKEKLAAVPDPESENTHWLPWILALILAVVGFLIGRSSAGGTSSSKKS